VILRGRGVVFLCAFFFKSEGRWFDPRWCHRICHWHTSFWSHYGPGVNSASNRNEYQGYFLGVNAAGAWGWQPYHHTVPFFKKSGNLTFLEPSGPLQACNGTALPFTIFFFKVCVMEVTFQLVLCSVTQQLTFVSVSVLFAYALLSSHPLQSI
jgi:hypothetical protein